MMQIECAKIALIATDDTFAALVLDKHLLDLASSLRDSLLVVLGAVSVCAFFWHTYISMPWDASTASCSTVELSRNICSEN